MRGKSMSDLSLKRTGLVVRPRRKQRPSQSVRSMVKVAPRAPRPCPRTTLRARYFLKASYRRRPVPENTQPNASVASGTGLSAARSNLSPGHGVICGRTTLKPGGAVVTMGRGATYTKRPSRGDQVQAGRHRVAERRGSKPTQRVNKHK